MPANGAIRAQRALFVGVPPLGEFGYSQIRELSTKVLEILAAEAPDTKHLAMTIHGVNYGLDEVESAEQQLSGYREALSNGRYPGALQSISIVDLDDDRVKLLTEAFQKPIRSRSYSTGKAAPKS